MNAYSGARLGGSGEGVLCCEAAGFSAAAISALGHPAAALRLAGFELGELRALGLDTSGIRTCHVAVAEKHTLNPKPVASGL